jgi:hypothetical protein
MSVHRPKHARRSRRYLAVTAAAATAVTAAGLPFAYAYASAPAAPPPPPKPQAVKATLQPTVRHLRPARAALPASYTVRRGDTLSAIAARFCGSAADYPALAANNGIRDADLIYPGELVRIACRAALAALAPDPAPADSPAVRPVGVPVTTGVRATVTAVGGTLGCPGLEALWEAAGGSPGDAFMAAEIAMAESGGRQYALSPTQDVGYWQINLSHGSLATYDALGNARAAIDISDDGTNWSAWTTWREGLEVGRC